MSPALPVVSGKQVVGALVKAGFVQVSQRGSHVKPRKADRVAIVPLHGELAPGTLSSILRQAGLSRDEFASLL